MDWQPIETAPRDGTVIDLWTVSETGAGLRYPDAHWSNEREHIFPGQYLEPGWRSPYTGWDCQCGGVEEDPWSERDGTLRFEKATHWMPLPNPPLVKLRRE